MKKKIKRISKMVMTIVLTATMLFGQLPSGLVLVANADTISGNGNSTLPDMSAGAAKYFNPDNGGGQIGDPKSLPDEEETSEEEGSEEDESETSSIEEESDSSKEKVEANSEKKVQPEEKTSEEKTSESVKNDVKDDEGDVGEPEPLPDPNPDPAPVDTKIDAPTEDQIVYVGEGENNRDYNSELGNDVTALFEFSETYNEYLEEKGVSVSLSSVVVSSPNAGTYDSCTVTCEIENEDILFSDGESKKSFEINKRVIINAIKGTVKFDGKVSKESDGKNDLNNTENLNFSFIVDETKIDDVTVNCINKQNLKYSSLVPATEIKIEGYSATDFSLNSANYEIESIDLIGEIKPKQSKKTIDLINNPYKNQFEIGTDDRILDSQIDKKVNVSFQTNNEKNNENIYWFNGTNANDGLLKLNDGAFYTLDEDGKYVKVDSLKLTEIANGELNDFLISTDDQLFFSDVKIKYNYDKTIPECTYALGTGNKYKVDNNTGFDANGIEKVGIMRANGWVPDSSTDFPETLELDKKGQGDVYIFILDKAHNLTIAKLDDKIANDETAPQITEIKLNSTNLSDPVYNNKKYLSSLNFEVNVTDEEGGSGIAYVKVKLMDGADSPLEYHEFKLYEDGNYSQGKLIKGSENEKKTCTIDAGNFGYELYLILCVSDIKGNCSYYRAYYSYDATAETDNESIVLGERLDEIIESDPVDISNTFAIAGQGENKASLNIQFNATPIHTENEEDVTVEYYDGSSIDPSVQFKKMAVSSISFDNSSIGENGSSFASTGYDSQYHYYKYDDIQWSFPAGNTKYIIRLNDEEKLVDAIMDYSSDHVFYVSDSTPEISFIISDPVGIRTIGEGEDRKQLDYYDSITTVTIRVSDKNSNFIKGYSNNFSTVAKIGERTVDVSGEWEWNETDESYTKDVTFAIDDKCYDGLCKLTVDAKNKNGKKGEGEKNFIIDSTKPQFKISYNDATNPVAINNHYYYGLSEGKGNPTDVVATVEITEANLFKNDIKLFVKKGDEEYKDPSDYGIDVNMGGVVENQPDKPVREGEDSPNKGIVVLTVKGEEKGQNDGEYILKVEYSDPVGKKMIITEDNPSYGLTENGEYEGTEHINVIDTIRPEATLEITKPSFGDNAHYKGEADYYKEAFKASFTINEKNFDDQYLNTNIIYLGDSDGINNTSMTFNKDKDEFFFTAEEEGKYQFSLYGSDYALNDMVFKTKENADKEESGVSENDIDDSEEGDEKVVTNNEEFTPEGGTKVYNKYTTGVKVLDKTAPKVTLTITPDGELGNKSPYSSDYNRFFFNQLFTGTFSVDELNYDRNLIIPVYRWMEVEDNREDSEPEKDIAGKFEGSDKEFIFNKNLIEKDALYVLAIQGTDKAGNQVVVDKESDKTYVDEKFVGVGLKSHIIVVDRTAPTLNIQIENKKPTEKTKDKIFFEANLTKDGFSATKNMPYQTTDSVEVIFTENDKSPANFDYKMDTTLKYDSSLEVEKGYKYTLDYSQNFNVRRPINGQQVINFNSVTVSDLAGNKISFTKDQYPNLIYLDTIPPEKNDNWAPTIQILPKSTSERGKGNSIFNKDVDITVNITDPNYKNEATNEEIISSAGLYQVYYTVEINEHQVSNLPKSAKVSDINDARIKYGDGYSFDWENRVDDVNNPKTLINNDSVTFHFGTDSFNYNNIRLTVWAEDNAGNVSPKATYVFGIDVTKPGISVSYNNNDVQNGKYFKNPRTATIVVRERNFDANKTHISTESGAHVSGWSYSRGGTNWDQNGDDDTWTATVTYDADGDYTLGVSAKDLVDNPAEGVNWNGSAAPTEFTIDLTKPVIAVSFDNNRVANGRYYNANRRATIDITEHNFDAKDATVERTAAIAEGTVAVPGIGNWSRINDINRNEVYFGQDGDYTMKVDYVDLAGNIAETYVVDLFTIDTVAPELEIGGVEDKHAYNKNTIQPSITYHDINYDRNNVKLSVIGNKNNDDKAAGAVPANILHGGSLTCSNIPENRDNDDIYTARASISDLAGNTTEKQLTFSVNRFGSTYEFIGETKNFFGDEEKFYHHDEITLEIKEINVNELTSYGVTSSVDGNTSKTLVEGDDFTVQQAHDGDGWWEYNYSIDKSNFNAEGNYLVELKSRDGAANDNGNRFVQKTVTETYEFPIEFGIDKTPPTLVMTGVEENGRYRADERTVIIRYEDSVSFLNNLKVYEGDKLVQEYDQKQLSELGGEIQYPAKASNKKQEIKVVAVDIAGNEGSLSSGQFLLTSNAFIQFVNNTPLLIAAIAGLVLLFGGIIFLVIMLTRRKRY